MPRKPTPKPPNPLVAENADLRARLSEAEEILGAIRSGEVDALIVSGEGDEQVFTLKEARALLAEANQSRAALLSVIETQMRAEESLAASENRFRALVENSSDGIVVFNAAGIITYRSAANTRILGYTNDEALSGTVVDQIHPDDLPQVRDQFIQLLKKRVSHVSLQYRHRHADGSWRWLQGVATNLLDEPSVQGIVANFRDISERKQDETQIRRNAARAEALANAAARLNAQLDLNAVLKAVCEETARALNVQVVAVSLYDSERDLFSVVSCCGIAPEHVQRYRKLYQPTPRAFYEQSQESMGAISVVPDIRGQLSLPNVNLFEALNGRTLIRASMMRGAQLVGVLNVLTTGEVREFTADELALLQALANQGVQAIANARLLRQSERRADEFAGLYDTAQALSALGNLPDLLQKIITRAMALLNVPSGTLYLYDAARAELELVFAKGLSMPIGTRLKVGEGMAGRVAQTRQPLSVDDYQAWEHRAPQFADVSVSAILEVPMFYGGELIGVLAVHELGETRRKFSEQEVRLLSLFAGQAAGAVHNARLLEETRTHAAQLTLLYEAGLALHSTLEQGAQLELLFNIAVKALNADRIEFFQYDAARNEFSLRLGSGHPPEVRAALSTLRFAADHERGLVNWVGRERKPLNLPDVSTDPRHITVDTTIHSELWVPVEHEQRLLGVMGVLSTRLHAFTMQDEQLLVLFANQAAGAMANAQHFQATQQQLAELEALNRISTALRMAQTLDEMHPLLLDATLAVFHTTAGSLWLYDPATQQLRRTVARGWVSQIEERQQPNEGIMGHVFTTGEPYLAQDASTDARVSQASRSVIPGKWAALVVPIRVEAETIGTLSISIPSPRTFSPTAVGLLTTIAEIAGGTIHRMRLHQQTEQSLQRLTAMRSIDLAILNSMDLRVTLSILLGQITDRLLVDAVVVMLLNPHSQRLEFAAARGLRSRGIERSSLLLGEGLAGRAALEGHTINIPDLSQASLAKSYVSLLTSEKFVAYVGVPLLAKGQLKGVLEIYHRAPLTPDADWLEFLETLAGQTALAIDSSQILERLQNSNQNLILAYETTLDGWSRALDLRDKETEGHTQRVTEMTVQLARTLGLSASELVHVRRGALLHDIGKMGVPDGILLKPGPLTDEEWVRMKQHPTYAFELLSPIAYLRAALDIPYCHHETWDGTGYPRGLKAEQIPLAARIFAVIDVWDALRSDRPYRAAWPEERAREYIQAQAGAHFDPQVVETFLKMDLV